MAIVLDNDKLSVVEWDNVWEPGLPLSPGVLDQRDKQFLLGGTWVVLWSVPIAVISRVISEVMVVGNLVVEIVDGTLSDVILSSDVSV